MAKKLVRRNIDDVPCSLHDAIIIEMKLEGSSMRLMFENGFYVIDDDEPHAAGYVQIDGLDLDFCRVCIFREYGGRKGRRIRFVGKWYELKEFIDRLEGISLEVVDEAFNYNTTRLTGCVIDKKGRSRKSFIIELYHEGDMSYIVE